MFNNIFRDPENIKEIRKHQVDTLKIFKDNVTEIVEDSEYSINFQCSGREMTLHISLPQGFPSEKPKLTVSPILSHSWVSTDGDVCFAPGLLNFSIHSDLGRVVHAIIREFQLRPPPLLDDPSAGHQDLNQSEPPSEQRASPNNYQAFLSSSASSNPRMPPPYPDYSYNFNYLSTQPMSAVFPELNALSTADLKELLENDDKIDNLIESLPIKQTFGQYIDTAIETVDKLAKENVELEPALTELTEEVKDKMTTLRKAKTEYDISDLEYRELCEKFNPFTIRKQLRESVTVVDEESERLADEFLEGNIDLDSFLSGYIEHRKISYSRKIRDEALSQQLEKLNQAGF